VRRLLWAALLVGFAVTVVRVGLPTDRVSLLGWVLAGLAVSCVGRGRRALLRLAVDWLPLVTLLLLYDLTRGLADTLGMPVHVTELIAADRFLTGGTLPTVWMQEHWQARWWKVMATLVYASHFVVTPAVLAVLWVRDRARWVGYARMVLALSAAGLVTYVLYPAAPPWLAAKDGTVEPIARISNDGWQVMGLPKAGALLSTGQGQVNAVAAVPSLHTAFAVLTCLVLLPLARHLWQRAALVAYAVLMPLVLVWSGEHYVIDTVLGALYAGAVCSAVPWLVASLRRRRTPAPAHAQAVR
jgi:TM2 domain-containing membrane protein YozV